MERRLKMWENDKVKLQMQEYNLEYDFFAVPLGGVDVVLGI